MSYVNTTTRETVDLSALRRAFPHMSFPADGPDDETLAAIGHARLIDVAPPTVAENQTVAEGPPELADGVWRQTWVVTELGDAEYAAKVQAARDAATQAAKDSCQTVLASLATRFSDLERQTWERQLAEATALLADPSLAVIPEDTSKWTDPIPTIRGIVAITGESLGDFAMSVQKNHEDWTAVSSNVIGQRQKLVAQIKACETIAAVTAIETTIILPG